MRTMRRVRLKSVKSFFRGEIADITVERYTRVILPYLFVLVAVIILIAFFPGVVLYLPNLLMG